MTTAPQPPPPPTVVRNNSAGTAALTLGVIGLLVAIIPILGMIGAPIAAVGLAFAYIGWRKVNGGEADNRRVVIASGIMSIAGLAWGVMDMVWLMQGLNYLVNG